MIKSERRPGPARARLESRDTQQVESGFVLASRGNGVDDDAEVSAVYGQDVTIHRDRSDRCGGHRFPARPVFGDPRLRPSTLEVGRRRAQPGDETLQLEVAGVSTGGRPYVCCEVCGEVLLVLAVEVDTLVAGREEPPHEVALHAYKTRWITGQRRPERVHSTMSCAAVNTAIGTSPSLSMMRCTPGVM